ncbi:hypothetical protein PSCICM_29050 [Pseudomonas cichorii]|nr:hypothetical protein PSCICM_29050 [Pseudomonas cichorii]
MVQAVRFPRGTSQSLLLSHTLGPLRIKVSAQTQHMVTLARPDGSGKVRLGNDWKGMGARKTAGF